MGVNGIGNSDGGAAAAAAAAAAARAAEEAKRAAEAAARRQAEAQARAAAAAKAALKADAFVTKPSSMLQTPKPADANPAALAALQNRTEDKLAALKNLPTSARQQQAIEIVQDYFKQAAALGATYQPEGGGGTSLVDEALASKGNLNHLSLGSDGKYDCMEAALQAQQMFATAGVDAKVQILDNGDGTHHAVLQVAGEGFDPSSVLEGKGPAVAGNRPVLAELSSSQLKAAFADGAQGQTRAMLDSQLGKVAELKANDDPATQAAADATNLLAHYQGGGVDPKDVAALIGQHPNDPIYAANLVAALYKQDQYNFGVGVVVGLNPTVSTPAAAQTLAAAVTLAESQGLIPKADVDQEVANYKSLLPDDQAKMVQANLDAAAANPTGALGASAATATLEAQAPAALDAVNKAKSDYEAAQAKAAEDNARLKAEMAHVGPGLTPDEQAAYAAKFHKDHQADYDAVNSTGAALKDALANPAVQLAATKDYMGAKAVVDAYKDLASSPYGKEAVKWATDVLNNPDSPLAKNLAQQLGPDYRNSLAKDIVTPGLQSATAEAIVESGGDLSKAYDEISELAENLKGVKELGDDGGKSLVESLAALKSASKGDFNPLKELGEDFTKMSPLGKAIAGACILVALNSGANAANKGDLTTALANFAEAGKDGIELLAGAAKAANDEGKLAMWLGEKGATDTLKVADWAARMAPGLGLISDALFFAADANNFRNDPSLANAMSLVGDGVSTIGAAMECFPATAPIGAVVDAVGTIVSSLGGVIDWVSKAGEIGDEEKELVKFALLHPDASDPTKVGNLSEDQAESIANDYSQVLIGNFSPGTFIDEAGLTPEQLQQFTLAHPGALKDGFAYSFADAAKALGIKGDDFLKMVDKISAKEGGFDQAMYHLKAGEDANTDPAAFKQWLHAMYGL